MNKSPSAALDRSLPELLETWRVRARRSSLLLVTTGVFALLCTLLALRFGAMAIDTAAVLSSLVKSIGLDVGSATTLEYEVITAIRGPRVALGFLVGASLSLAGAAMQGMFRNPLADPGLIGVSAGAGAGAAAMIILFDVAALALLGPLAWLGVSIAAFAGGLGATALVYAIGTVGGQSRIAIMLLAGIALSSVVGAFTGFLVFLADDAQLRTLTFWTLGSVGDASWSMVAVAAIGLGLSVSLLYPCRYALNVWLLGERQVHQLGFSVRRTRRLLIAGAALAVSLAVAVAGVVSFVGLVIPHIARLLVGSDHERLFPATLLLGGGLLVLADLVARTIAAPAEMPLSVITALIGGPFFLFLIVRNRASWM
ncbi:MAG: iron ABC transporter permease [Myxococcota bacterium]